MNPLFEYEVKRKKHLDKTKEDDIVIKISYHKPHEMPITVSSILPIHKAKGDKEIMKHIEMHLKSFSKNIGSLGLPRPGMTDEDELKENILHLIKRYSK